VREYDHHWEGTISSTFVIEDPPLEFPQRIRHKALAILPTKLNKDLPQVLYSDRVRQLYEKGLSFNNYSIKKLLQRNPDIEPA
jgi:hypothetical protein